MSISDDSGTVPVPKLANGESRKARRARVRLRYESSELSLRELGKLENVPESTIFSWSTQDGWKKRKQLVKDAVRSLETDISQKALQHAKDELEPYIAQHKAKIIKRGVRVGNHGLSRIEKLWRTKVPTEAKSEADAARAVESFVRTVRTSLGMSDGKTDTGRLSLRVMAPGAAIAVEAVTD